MAIVFSPKVKKFLKEYQLHPQSIRLQQCIDQMLAEMDAGLRGQPSSLAMIPTYLSCDVKVPIEEPVIVMDAGGTNVRVCTVIFHENAPPTIENFNKYRMPGLDRVLSAQEFYDTLVSYLLPVASKANKIGFCFSYPSEISPQKDGKLLRWTKEVKVPEVEGQYIGQHLLAVLAQRGYENKSIVLLNDTVATLLAGKSIGDQYGCQDYIGFILGTGTNTAYLERHTRIIKLPNLPSYGKMAINMESGNFNKIPTSPIDDQFDATTVNPGYQRFEKMISGAYLGPLALHVLKVAVNQGLFSASASKVIMGQSTLDTVTMDNHLHNPRAINNPFGTSAFSLRDQEIIYQLFYVLVHRAAMLTSVNISTPILQTGSGKSPLSPVGINIDGSTYYKTFRFQLWVEHYLEQILGKKGIFFKTMKVDNAPIIGAAIAGLIG